MDRKQQEDQRDREENEQSSGLSRREFLGAAVAAGALLTSTSAHANSASQVYYYQDSFGNVAPAGGASVGYGIYPPPVSGVSSPAGDPPAGCGTPTGTPTYYACGYPQQNILLTVVDQMRNLDFWLPPNGYADVQTAMPNITRLAGKSYSFPNYWTCATVCGPARACLLTGLYSQQHGIYIATGHAGNYDANKNAPPLLPYKPSWAANGDPAGFPTIANVLSQGLAVGNTSQSIHYDCTWIGKWHLSCMSALQDGNPGANGPADYGFNSAYSVPRTPISLTGPYPSSANGYPSPDGTDSGAAGGDFLDSVEGGIRNVVAYPTGASYLVDPARVQINDAAIARAFYQYWLPMAETTFNNVNGSQLLTPWFCGVSFINPHDISAFPYPYNLAGTDPGNFGLPSSPINEGFQPPPTAGSAMPYGGNNCPVGGCTAANDIMYVGNYTAPYSGVPAGGGVSAPWNFEDPSSPALSWANNGKPACKAGSSTTRSQNSVRLRLRPAGRSSLTTITGCSRSSIIKSAR